MCVCVSYSRVNYSHHVVYYIFSTSLSNNWKYVPFDHLSTIFPPMTITEYSNENILHSKYFMWVINKYEVRIGANPIH